MPPKQDPAELAALRVEIDRIDAAMHGLLMERGQIIERLIETKKSRDSGSAFRPGREASMMRALVERHEGLLPLDTVESIWRVIIGTFTYVQAPYSVHADISAGDAAMRDSARFHFGFTVPFVPQEDAGRVIAAVAGSAGDLGVFRIDQDMAGGVWWRGLLEPQAPKIIARLPFVERSFHPAGTPIFVVSKPLADAAVRDVLILSVSLEGASRAADAAFDRADADIIADATDAGGRALLVAVDGERGANALAAALKSAGIAAKIHEVGGHAPRFEAPARKQAVPRAARA